MKQIEEVLEWSAQLVVFELAVLLEKRVRGDAADQQKQAETCE